jgi:hypothetical protein
LLALVVGLLLLLGLVVGAVLTRHVRTAAHGGGTQ